MKRDRTFRKNVGLGRLEDQGNKVLKYFCLDIDRSNHSAKDCAAAIKMSINKLEMAGLNISEIVLFVITGNTGGYGASQHIHPLLVQIGMMSKKSKKMNCQLHALNRGFQGSCEATFGKQGIGQNNIFQGEYIYVKMIRTLHEDGGATIVDAVHSCVVQKLTTSLEWQEESLKHGVAFEECWDRIMATPALDDDDAVDAIAELATTHARNIQNKQ